MRSTLIDIARESGVSTATVDRVLNNRPGVRERTRLIVMEVATRLGYFTAPTGQDSRLRIDFVLPEGTNAFILNLKSELERQISAMTDLDARIHTVEGFNPDVLAAKLAELEDNSQGVGLLAFDHPAVREAMRRLADRGVKIVTMVSDIQHTPRIGYVGVDNRAAGRLAGYMIGRFLPKDQPQKIALFAGSLAYRGHEEREMGFRHILSEEFPYLEIVDLREIRDDRIRAYAESTSLLKRHLDLAGIYNIGGGNSGIGKALDECGRGREVVFVGHEVTEDTRLMLIKGTMDALIDQNPRVEARETISMLKAAIRGEAISYIGPRIQVVLKENIPDQ
ncbi:LacI family DNA-binding transcriptional regulator [Rhizobium sp. RU36D]|uniref:LacI family DNA-binding transcriptional regulator n=1 Tax=Rhizobium sp. RU36D TaxID=1907415 RepID=UPI0009D8D503|nr:LacI family DNA-binding transcriptional regulator [Rhizobium sp. RU36D]SMC93532.1 transcriptional regulator, LacI family [Rhizobium sp. RU36D]